MQPLRDSTSRVTNAGFCGESKSELKSTVLSMRPCLMPGSQVKSILSPPLLAAESTSIKTVFRRERKQSVCLTTSHKQPLNTSQRAGTEKKMLFSPQGTSNGASLTGTAKSNEKLMDRYIPCRVSQNLTAKFDAAFT